MTWLIPLRKITTQKNPHSQYGHQQHQQQHPQGYGVQYEQHQQQQQQQQPSGVYNSSAPQLTIYNNGQQQQQQPPYSSSSPSPSPSLSYYGAGQQSHYQQPSPSYGQQSQPQPHHAQQSSSTYASQYGQYAPQTTYGQQQPQQYPHHSQPHGGGAPQYGGYNPTGYSIDPLREFFDFVDIDRSGSIDAKELKAALSRSSAIGCTFSDECAQMMIRMFDRTGDRVIDFGEFEQLHRYLLNMRSAFDAVDTDRSGKLDFNEVINALQRGGFMLSPQTIQTIFQKFDRSRTNALALDGYIEMCVFLGTARNIFARHDTNRSGSAWFNMDSFISACTNFV